MADRDMGDEVGSKRPLDGGGDYGGAKRARSSRRYSESGGRVELRLLIPTSAAGAIIGKGGSNIKELRLEYSASVQIPDSRGVERVVNTSASSIENLSHLCGRISSCVHSEHPYTKSQEVRMLVHKSQAGTIIGTRGFKIRELRETTNAAIKVFQDCCPNSTDRICQIRGSNDVIVGAVKIILEMLETAPPKGPVARYDPNCLAMGGMDDSYEYGGFMGDDDFGSGNRGGRGNFSGRGGRDMFQGGQGSRRGGGYQGGRMRGGRGGGGGNFGRGPMGGGGFRGGRGGGNYFSGRGGGNDYGQDNYGGSGGYGNFGNNSNNGQGSFVGGGRGGDGGPETTTKVTIPTALAGSIIGKGGQRIRQIRQDCGAQIKIDEPAPGSNDRIITIIGTQEQIQNAQYLLQTSVKMYAGDKY